jgi:hypothetical protein
LLLSGIPVGAMYDVRVRYQALGCWPVAERTHGDYGTLLLDRLDLPL